MYIRVPQAPLAQQPAPAPETAARSGMWRSEKGGVKFSANYRIPKVQNTESDTSACTFPLNAIRLLSCQRKGKCS